ncbi:MAG: hypothetical protein QM779_15475 [Propionicimonas sp.]|uniref:hypothetical protein n=1 Tax=Propionicimonas sp. TaxID=1955623 RepID=UPI003D0C51E6
MTWRWVWLRSRLTAIVASALIWIALLPLVPDVVAAFVLLGAALVAGWRARLLLWWRFGVRRVGPADAEVVWRALVPFEWLRGRNQPQLWSSSRSHAEVVAADARQLVMSERLIGQVSQHSVPDQDLRRLVVRALATADVHRSRLGAAVEVFCLPWSILASVGRAVSRPLASLRLPTLAWHGRWLFVALAAADLYRQAHWPGLVMLLLAAIATVTTPRWNRSWAGRQIVMVDAFESDHPTTPASQSRSGATTPRRVRAGRPADTRGAGR